MTLVLMNASESCQVVNRVPEGLARREHLLRDLIHDHPEILPVHTLDPSFGRVFTVARELNVPGVGFIDVVLADERGRLVVVECKLWRNPQARREVVGQILDYARQLSRYAYEDLQRQIAVTSGRQGNVLYAMAREAGSELDETAFVDRVSRDLAAGRFLLLVVGDGITEGTRRIGEYLRDQPGLAFDFGLIELAEYRYTNASGVEQVIVQPRVLAQTAVIERHVIRSDVPGLVIDAIGGTATSDILARPPSEAGQAWRNFVERFVAVARFDDPAQPAPRSGGVGWIRLPLPLGLYANLYRSQGEQAPGRRCDSPAAKVRWPLPNCSPTASRLTPSSLRRVCSQPYGARVRCRRWPLLMAHRYLGMKNPRRSSVHGLRALPISWSIASGRGCCALPERRREAPTRML